MLEVGVLGLDTSHASSFADIISSAADATIAAVWDSSDTRDEAYIQSFCEEYDARRYRDPQTMVEAVDAAMVLTVDWDRHVPLAELFLEAGIPTLVDKPLAGCLSGLNRLGMATEDAQLFGGSAVPFHPRLADLPQGGTGRTLYAAGYNDYFYYRVHLTDTVRFLADSPWESVELTSDPGTTLRVTFKNGMHTILRYDGGHEAGAFGVLDVTDQARAVELPSDEATLGEMYDPYIEAFLETARGSRDNTARILDSARLALAVEATIDNGHQLTPHSSSLEDVSVDATPFVADYEPYY